MLLFKSRDQIEVLLVKGNNKGMLTNEAFRTGRHASHNLIKRFGCAGS
jgi:hypothetical protein